MGVAAVIASKLTAALAPERLQVSDDSHRHHGHAEARPEGESHFRVLVVSHAFEGKSRLERQRLVHRVLAEELASDVHALALTALAPSEDRA